MNPDKIPKIKFYITINRKLHFLRFSKTQKLKKHDFSMNIRQIRFYRMHPLSQAISPLLQQLPIYRLGGCYLNVSPGLQFEPHCSNNFKITQPQSKLHQHHSEPHQHRPNPPKAISKSQSQYIQNH